MSDTVIKVENLSKQYRIGAREGYKTFRETLVDAAKAPFRAFKKLNPTSDLRPPTSELIWALKNVSFEVKQGEVVGIIGRNGAGKSTLLKILSQITEPTEGRVELKGRIGSLLEVGTGFHPELTGHENIYLYGAILGMDRWEVTRKFDEIVAFSEIDKFIDTPVKRYSSGMYMRLAFAVAAHMETEILLVDEVLAVGDAVFQKKCLGKMGDVSKEGRTVLFVSHNMAAVKQLCRRGILLEKGLLKINSNDITKLIHSYIVEDKSIETNKSIWKTQTAVTNNYFHVQSFSLCDKDGNIINTNIITNDENHYLLIDFLVTIVLRDLRFGIVIYSEDNLPILTSEYTDQIEKKSFSFKIGPNSMRIKIPAHFLNEGIFRVELTASSPSVGWILYPGKDVCPRISFEIRGGLSNSPCWTSKRAGFMAPILEWDNR